MSKLRFRPLALANGLILNNRLVVPPMASQTADSSGRVTEQTLAHYRQLARSGAGLVMVEYSHVALTGRSEPNQLGAHDEACVPGLTLLASELHRAGVVTGLQLTHCGGKASQDVCGDLMGPSGITVPAYDRTLEAPRAMTSDDIRTWHRDFVAAAVRADQAGFDLVEIHCAHGYGINQWLSPLTNQRSDRYGGSLRNRARLLLEIIEGIRVAAPRLGVIVRIPGQDGYPEGLSQDDMRTVAGWLVEAGVLLLDISSGIGGWNRPKARRGEGYLVAESRALCGQLGVPVIGVGGIESADYMETALAERWLDLAAVGRAILKDPVAFREGQMQPGNTAPTTAAPAEAALAL
ncbi:NADH:flavin oxidoreductase [Ferrimonas balearica]|uniref:oxidoreductase n=1 Tax=Ferrimonas balearica TaxID=44012 RepID=UPI001C9A06F1|nr:NADH:flavin oxidoreductase [Ferrimonas balearica]MBY5990907.1 NADH:flavin oxidoreductase [Ferrimonas balearica]